MSRYKIDDVSGQRFIICCGISWQMTFLGLFSFFSPVFNRMYSSCVLAQEIREIPKTCLNISSVHNKIHHRRYQLPIVTDSNDQFVQHFLLQDTPQHFLNCCTESSINIKCSTRMNCLFPPKKKTFCV